MAEIASIPLRAATDAAYTSRWRSARSLAAFSAMAADPERQANYLDIATGAPSALTQALSTLRSKGGQMYLAGPANRIASDGQGPIAVDGDPIGWARNLAGDSAATQAARRSQPKLVRAPILGPELVVNGDFSNGLTGWVVVPNSPPGTIDIVAGEAVVTSQGGFTNLNNVGNRPTVLEGRQYRLTYSGRLAGASAGWVIVGRTGAGDQYGTLPITTDMRQRTLDITAAGSDIALALQVNATIVGGQAIFDNISVREILGHTDRYYWEFDGLDDQLEFVPPTAAVGNGLLLCAAHTALRWNAAVTTLCLANSGSLRFQLGVSDRRVSSAVVTDAGVATGFFGALNEISLGVPYILTAYIDSEKLVTRLNGTEISRVPVNGTLTGVPLTTGTFGCRARTLNEFANVRVQAPVITTGITTLAEVQQIERAVAQAAGVTLP